MPVQTVIKTRRDTSANWALINPVLAAGEVGLEADSGLIKYGDGTSTWSALQYSAASRVVETVKNNTLATIPKGSVVYISGATGDNALIALADADTETTSSKTLGFVVADIASGAIGQVVTNGLLTKVDTALATAGQSVWLSGTAGGFVFGNPPSKPAHSVYLGVVIRAHANNGEILVKVQNGYELNELHDVNAGSPSGNDLLAWDMLTSMWVNRSLSSAGIATLSNPTFTGTVNASDVTISGDLTVGGTTTTVNAQDLVVEDPLIYIGEGNGANLVDLGFVASFDDGTYQHSGLVRDSSDSKWKLFKGVIDEPTTTINFAQGSLDALAVGAFEATSATIGDVSNTELQYLNGVTSAVQTQLDAKAPSANPTFTGTVDFTSATVTGIDALPDQTGNNGYYLKTDGSTATWAAVSAGSSDLNGLSDVSVALPSTNDVLYFNGLEWTSKNIAAIPTLLNAQSGTSYTLVLADAGKVIDASNSSANTVTIPLNSSVAFPIGTQITVLQAGTGQTSINIASGGTLNAGLQGTANTAKLRAQWSAAVLIKRATDTWVASGDLVA